MKVFVSGSFDPPHSGHIAFFKEASEYGDLYVGIGSDKSITKYKHDVFMPEEERLFIVKSIRYVKKAFINSGMGNLDYSKGLSKFDRLVVNKDQDTKEKRNLCAKLGVEYIVLIRLPALGLPTRKSSELRK